MMMATDEILAAVAQLPFEQRELLLNLLQRRQIESRREQIAEHATTAHLACQAGQLPLETATDLLKRLHASLLQEE